MPLPLPQLRDDPIAADLRRMLRGNVRFDDHVRMLYATDASIYQVAPIGEVEPADVVDVQKLLRYCDDHRIPVLPRGGGTSLAGQCTNRAVVCDLSPTFREIVEFDRAAKSIDVQPGLSFDQVNRWLDAQQSGLFLAPDPATSAQCSIGGAIGNNAAGARSIRYGRTSENLHGLQIVLPGGETTALFHGAGRRSPVALRLAQEIGAIAIRYANEIRSRYPKLNRRNAGYGIDLIVRQLDDGIVIDDLDLSGLICGSEGTLGVVTAARMKLHAKPKRRGLAIASFPSIDEAIDAVQSILATGAIAVELLDEEVLTAAAANNECRKYLYLLAKIGGELPRAVLYVEYQDEADGALAIDAGFEALRKTLPAAPTNVFTDAAPILDAWALRKAGEPLLHALSATRKPLTFVEDNSVPVSQLSRFVRGFKKIVAAHGTRAAYYAHASVGVLHIRPMIDLHDPADRERMKSIAQQAADLARECGGVMSGEHGDGRVRGPLLERFFGSAIMECFSEIKRVFDPHGIMNPGMIVDAGSVDSIVENLRTDRAEIKPVETYFDYADQEGFHGALEMCNGAGFCRKTSGGTMCPSYRATLDERHSTRGRGNALRLAISGQLRRDSSGTPDFTDAGTIETLDLCLSCKACKSECPSNVDLSRLKAEYTAQRYRESGRAPLRARLFGHVRTLNKLGSLAPELSNWLAQAPLIRSIADRLLGLAPQRSLPRFEHSLFSKSKPEETTRPKVVLFGDCFTAYNEPKIGLAAIGVLQACGYEVIIADAGCCGRAMISTGLLEDAIRTIDSTFARLAPFVEDPNVRAIVFAEPSCLSAIKDDWLELKATTPRALRTKLAAKSFLVEEFVDREWDSHPARPKLAVKKDRAVVLHGHCHQKALWGDATSANILRRLLGASHVIVLSSGCCGMAGSFGFTADHYQLSMKIGELSVFPPIRGAPSDATILAPGTSCRHQIRDGTGREALHPIEFLAGLLD